MFVTFCSSFLSPKYICLSPHTNPYSCTVLQQSFVMLQLQCDISYKGQINTFQAWDTCGFSTRNRQYMQIIWWGSVFFFCFVCLFVCFLIGCCLHVLFDCFAKSALNTPFGLTLQLCQQLSKQTIKQPSRFPNLL